MHALSLDLVGPAVWAAIVKDQVRQEKHLELISPENYTGPAVMAAPAVTTRGMKEKEMIQLADWMCDVLDHHDDQELIVKVKAKVVGLCQSFPVYGR
jgi:glycine hydroxymethyltransferase